MINTNKLKAKMVEKGYTQRTLAPLINMNKNTLNSKLNGKTEFYISEAVRICQLLDITDGYEISNIFLPKLSQNWD